MEKRLRNLYEHELFYSDYQMPKIYNFHYGRPCRQLPHPIPARSYATVFFFLVTSCDETHLNREKFKKSLWNMIFFLNVDIKMK